MSNDQEQLRQVEPHGQDAGLDLQGYWRVVMRRRWLALPFFLATVLVATVITLRQQRIYEATCTVIIELSAPRVLEKDQVQEVMESGTGGYWSTREYYETQYKVIASRAVAQRVSDRLQLGMNEAFLGVDARLDPEQRTAAMKAKDPVTILQRNLRVEPVKDSRVVRLKYQDLDPGRASLIANAFADAYIAENLSVKASTTQGASEWLEGQLAELERKLADSSKALFDFKRDHDIVSTTWEDRQSMVSQRITAVNDALTRTRVKKAEVQARQEAVRQLSEALAKGPVKAEALLQLPGSESIQQLRLKVVETESDCADMRVKYLGDHPKLQACDERVALAREALRNEIKSTVETARREYDEVLRTEQNLVVLLESSKSDAFGLNRYEQEYLELKRSYDNNQRLYEIILKRLKDTGVASMLQVSNVRVLEHARPNGKPVRPSIPQNLAIALVVGLVGAVALAFLAEGLDSSITGREQVEERLGLAFLGIVPRMERPTDGKPNDLFTLMRPKSAAAECLRAVRTNLLFMSPEKPLKTLLVTSSGPQEGKTTTATSLALTMALNGQRVMLVDADMRRPRIHRIFGVPNDKGLSSLILGEGTLATVAAKTNIQGLSVVPCGPVPPNPAELLHTKAFRGLLAEMEGQFDFVIIDSPPVGVVADAVVMSTLVDGAVLVLKAGKTPRDVARHAVRQLRDVKAHVFGAVLNDLDLADQRYGRYSYYYQYGYYYRDERGDTKTEAAGA